MTRLRLEFTGGPRRGDASVFSASRVTVGRSRSNTFVLPETLAPAASGRHAEFSHEDGAWWLSCSSQSGSNGALYNVTTGGSTGYTWVYGPEDLAVDAAEGWLWSLTEHAGERAVFAVDLSDVGG